MVNFEGLAAKGSQEEELLSKIDFNRLPEHVAVIMDGNGRWAAKRKLPRVEGHRAGIRSVREVVETSARLGIKVLTLYAFSVENWKRPKREVDTLMGLLKQYLRKELSQVKKNNVRFRAIGRLQELPSDIQREVTRASEETKNNTGMILNIALNYGGRTEIVDALRSILQEIKSNGKNDDLVIDEELIARNLYTEGISDPDLLIRTSGEMRISNFLLWQIAYSEIWITPILWPDFRKLHLYEGIIEFQKRDRRYGAV